MKPVIVRPKAEQDIRETFDWYEAKERGLGEKFKVELQKLFDNISTFPEMNTERATGFRYGLCQKMKVFVAYKVRSKEILVYRVWYATMNPDQWSRKLSAER